MTVAHLGAGSRAAVLVMGLAMAHGSSAAPLAPVPGASPAAMAVPEISRAVERVYPSLVRISAVTTLAVSGREEKHLTWGSGVIVSPDGYVVTNHHVVRRAGRIWCTLSTREEVEGTLVGSDALGDIGVIKLQAPRTYPFATWGDSDQLKIGQPVFAMGSPGSLAQTVTSGIVSNPCALLPPAQGGQDAFYLDGERVGSVVRWIMHDAPIDHGSSGGPLVDEAGQLVGINELEVSGLGGAIPSRTARRLVDELIAHGTITRSFTGIELGQRLSSQVQSEGALVRGVIPTSPAEKAGLVAGDLLVSYNGEPVSARYAEEVPALNQRMLDSPPGKPVPLEVLRADKRLELTLTTELRDRPWSDDRELVALGVTGRTISRLSALELKLSSTAGVLVSTVRQGGAAGDGKPPLMPGDVIVKIGPHPIGSLLQVDEACRKVVGTGTQAVACVVEVQRELQSLLTVLRIGPVPPEEPATLARHPWFPAATQVFTPELAEALGLPGVRGVRITQIYPPLAGKGFQVGDLITHVNDLEVEVSAPNQNDVFLNMIYNLSVDTPIDMKVLRGGKPLTVPCTLPASPPSRRELPTHRDPLFEIVVRDLTLIDRIEAQLSPGSSGVVVEEVVAGGWGALALLQAGDLVRKVGGTPIASVSEFEHAMKQVARERPGSVAFFVQRGIHTVFAEVRPNWGRDPR